MNKLVQLLRYDVRAQIGFILFLISLYTTFVGKFYQESIDIYIAVAAAIIIDGLILRLQKKKFVFPYSAVVAGFLIGLILNPQLPSWQFALIASIAIISKYLILPGKSHIFNPAAFGLVFASIIFDGAISWWGVAWSSQIWIFIFLAAGYVLLRLRRIWLPVGFLLVYWSYLTIIGGFSISIISDPTVALFTFVMLPEPQTSPIRNYFRYLFGVLVALSLVFYSALVPKLQTDLLLISLLTANLLAFIFLILQSKISAFGVAKKPKPPV
ncbi:MAG: RnfABCDGE type electron transport complex subunit D [Candidatus Woykebacteria bacterium]